MFPNMLCGACKSHNRRNLKMNMKSVEPMSHIRFKDSTPFNMDPNKPVNRNRGGIKKMSNKVSTFSDLIHRVTASCMLHPLTDNNSEYHDQEQDSYEQQEDSYNIVDGYEEDYIQTTEQQAGYRTTREMEMMTLISEVFETVSSMKKAYVSLQEAHCPWDEDKIRLSDVAVVAEMKRLGFLRERFHRTVRRLNGGAEDRTMSAETLREVVAPYEAALEKMNTEINNKELEVYNLRQKLKMNASTYNRSCSKKSRSSYHQSKKRVSCSSQFQRPSMSSTISPRLTAVPKLFEACMHEVKEGSRTFSLLLLSLMKAADWDIIATVKSITGTTPSTTVGSNHAKYSVESYVNRMFFQGFEHETFYIDGNLSSVVDPNEFRLECFTKYSDMKSMDPMELLGILPTCLFGKFCWNKYLSMMHPKMEESLFGDVEQRRQVLAGNHPRSLFYSEFLSVAKAVWLLHLVAFSLDPLPSHFEGSRGAEFHPEYMESVVRATRARAHVVAFPVSPGFKLGDGYVVKARVFLVPNNQV